MGGFIDVILSNKYYIMFAVCILGIMVYFVIKKTIKIIYICIYYIYRIFIIYLYIQVSLLPR